MVRLDREIKKQHAENECLHERNRLLATEVDSLNNDTEGIEERAGQQMGMIKEG